MKKLTKLRYILLLVITAFLSLSASAQRERDTVAVIMLFCDTSFPTIFSYESGHFGGGVFWMKGYSVREKHRTDEGVPDPGGAICFDMFGKKVDCYYDYWVHVEYLDNKKKRLPKNIVVWQSQ